MTEVTLGSEIIQDSGLYLTPSGEIALATPLPMKEYIHNESRAEAGKQYLLTAAQYDDANISVQCAIVADNDSAAKAALSSFSGLFTNGKGTIGGVKCLYKSISNIQKYKTGIYVFSANLIKLANQS